MIGPGPYRATKLWNETVRLFCGGMPRRRHWVHFRCYDNTFTASEAISWLHELLKHNHNFGPEVTRHQTLQLLRKFLKNHVMEDIKGRYGTEDLEDNGRLYRFPPTSPFKPLPRRPCMIGTSIPKFPLCKENVQLASKKSFALRPLLLNSESWNKRHSIAIGELRQCRLVQREITSSDVENIWKSMTLAHLQRALGLKSLDGMLDAKLLNPSYIVHNVYNINRQAVVVLKDISEDLPHWVLSAMKCLANWPDGSDTRQSIYPGFEKDVMRMVADYFWKLKEPLLTFHFYDLFVSVLGLLQQPQVAVQALQVCCVLLPPANRRKLQLLMSFMARVCRNAQLPLLDSIVGTRTLVLQTFSRSILCSAEEGDLDELLAMKLVAFMLDNYENILSVPSHLQNSTEEHIAHLQRAQIKYAGADTDASLLSSSSQGQFGKEEYKEQMSNRCQEPLEELLCGIIADKSLSAKQKKRKLKQFQMSYPEVYKKYLPTPDSEVVVLQKCNLRRPQLLTVMKKPFQPFQRTWSFRA